MTDLTRTTIERAFAINRETTIGLLRVLTTAVEETELAYQWQDGDDAARKRLDNLASFKAALVAAGTAYLMVEAGAAYSASKTK